MTEEILEKLRITAIEPAPQADVAWGLRAGVETQPAAGGTHVLVHRLAASQADITIEAESLRQFVAALPREVQGSGLALVVGEKIEPHALIVRTGFLKGGVRGQGAGVSSVKA